MKRFLAVAVFTVLTTTLHSFGQMPDDHAKAIGGKGSVEEELMQMERDWTAADLNKDTKVLDRILAEDWVGQFPVVGTVTKSQAMDALKSGDSKIESETLGDMKVRVFADAAVVTGSEDIKSSYMGKDISGHYVWTDIYVKRQGHWQSVATHSSQVPQP